MSRNKSNITSFYMLCKSVRPMLNVNVRSMQQDPYVQLRSLAFQYAIATVWCITLKLKLHIHTVAVFTADTITIQQMANTINKTLTLIAIIQVWLLWCYCRHLMIDWYLTGDITDIRLANAKSTCTRKENGSIVVSVLFWPLFKVCTSGSTWKHYFGNR